MEEAMSTISLEVSSDRRRQASLWTQLKHGLAEWRLRARLRRELVNLSDETLRDIGMSRGWADFEASKPFWMA